MRLDMTDFEASIAARLHQPVMARTISPGSEVGLRDWTTPGIQNG
ncbi:hypothetical protein [Rhizobium sp. 1399]|jgi:hypothetical protein|nr:hypothetical protein [Rhizobium sp. 1399]MDR6665079.1 hypothetical protein [Rhizobium sp. 1399]